ncbi:MAG: tRNA (adenosine(37)-N6)-dimethylallyltransferase MiaA [Frankiaceae bacterium]|nr:tRNA (adenosine(37)-N6)-dimethylallyltransferase MiaA [Frankiaceae bacterium]
MTSGRVVAVVGPTGAGKSELGIALARELGGEIINADSMQLYRGMDVGTAKVPPAQRGGIAHHLLDVWELERSATVAAYQAIARASIEDVLARGRTPILVGGSGLYLRAALDPLDFPGESPQIRARLESELAEAGPGELHRRLRIADPLAATGILASNGRRLVRALEVIELTGRPYSATLPSYESVYDVVHLGLDRADLDERVGARVHQMIADGFVEEVRSLLPRGLRAAPTAAKALGYAQLLTVLDDSGRLVGDLPDAIGHTISRTRRFVRRQRSWFRRDHRIAWLDPSAADLVAAAVRLATGPPPILAR